MKILLINNNPVVSRLTALSARKENVTLDEIKSISDLKTNDYDIIFVDGESYNNNVSNIIRNADTENKVLFYVQGEDEHKSIFTKTILKPFLPSEVSEILRSKNISLLKEKDEKKDKPQNVDFQNLVKESKDKELEKLTIEKIDKKTEIKAKEKDITEKEPLLDLTTSTASIASTKKSSRDKKIEKDEFELKIEETFPLNLENNEKKDKKTLDKDVIELNSDLFDLDEAKASTQSNSDLFEIDNKKDTLKDEFDSNLFEIDKEIKQDMLGDSPLDFDKDSKHEVSFEPLSEKKEKEKITEKPIKNLNPTTQILNDDDISDIKDILDEKKGSEKLTQIPTSLNHTQESELKEEKITSIPKEEKTLDKIEELVEEPSKKENLDKRENIDKNELNLAELTTGDAIAQTLNRLPVNDLRQLLRGAKINISIEFPKDID